MDTMHKIEGRSWISESISVTYFTDYLTELNKTNTDITNTQTQVKDEMRHLTNFDDELLTQLEKDTDVSLLDCPTEIAPKPLTSMLKLVSANSRAPAVMDQIAAKIPPEGKQCLRTLELQAKELKRRENAQYKRLQLSSLKYSYVDRMQRFAQQYSNKPGEGQHGHEILFSVSFYRPILTETYVVPHKRRFPKADHQFLVIGSNTLAELKDKITCCNDLHIVPKNPELASLPFSSSDGPQCKEEFPSSYIFIEDTFYDDRRHPKSHNDLSEVVLKWSEKALGVGELKRSPKNMDGVRFKELQIRLGRPYVYVHQGYCEHLMIFTDARLLHKHDCQDLSQYPILKDIAPRRPVLCMICGRFIAKFIATEHDRVPELPFFFCASCHSMYNYNSIGEPIGKFKISQFYDRSVVL